jgi:peptide chain release factor
MNNDIIIQITSGRGPAECCFVVAQVLRKFMLESQKKGLNPEIINQSPGIEPGTLVSALVKMAGEGAEAFAGEWQGTVLWVGQSPFRKYHKRKNWYAGVYLIPQNNIHSWNESDIVYQTLRSSGPGGQHVNKTESAVRATHLPSGIQVLASDSRSQIQNKKLATLRLQEKLTAWQFTDLVQEEYDKWNKHNQLERGNPVKVFKGWEFIEVSLPLVCIIVLML